jgi:hypothetical protein
VWKQKWKHVSRSETGSYESTGGARKSEAPGKAVAPYPSGNGRTGARARGIALRGIDTMTGVRALESLTSLRASERDERSRRFGMSEKAWLENVDRRGPSGRRNETGEGCWESKENDEQRPVRDERRQKVGEDSKRVETSGSKGPSRPCASRRAPSGERTGCTETESAEARDDRSRSSLLRPPEAFASGE